MVFICLDVRNIGVGVQVNVPCIHNIIFIPGAEACGRAELPDLIPYNGIIKFQRFKLWILLQPVCGIIGIMAKLKKAVRFRIIIFKIGEVDGPAAVRHPVAFFKVERIKYGAVTCPVAGGAAKIMQPR